jgi:signal peptidase I
MLVKTALAAVVVVSALLVGSSLAGYRHYVVTGGSMQTSIPRGSLVFDRTVPTADLRVGDVITYAPPPEAHVQGLLTHRIIRAGRLKHGKRVLRTKGDANPTPDPWRFVLDRTTQARVEFHVPVAGYALATLSEPRVRTLLIGLPALLLAFSLLAGLWQDAGREARLEAGGN